jgi:hypothetical protein
MFLRTTVVVGVEDDEGLLVANTHLDRSHDVTQK